MMKAALIIVLSAFASLSIADPLFEDDTTLSISLTAPIDTIEDDRDKSQKYPGVLNFAGKDYTVDVEVRGNKRLSDDTCSYPPLRIDFKKKEIKGTLFDKQNDIKLVVLCKRGSSYEAYLRTEFLVYKALNLLTDISYQVRWINISYHDSARPNKSPDDGRVESAFFIERKSRVAKRVGMKTTDVERIRVSQLEQKQAALISLFQYAVANPDYSIVAPPPGDECCHNAKLLVKETNEQTEYVPIIYDFDSTGVVNARYAVPHESLGIRRVTQRLYRGYCAQNEPVKAIRSEFLAKRDAIISLFENDPLLDKRYRRSTVKFLNRSFDTIADDKKFNSEIIDECR